MLGRDESSDTHTICESCFIGVSIARKRQFLCLNNPPIFFCIYGLLKRVILPPGRTWRPVAKFMPPLAILNYVPSVLSRSCERAINWPVIMPTDLWTGGRELQRRRRKTCEMTAAPSLRILTLLAIAIYPPRV